MSRTCSLALLGLGLASLLAGCGDDAPIVYIRPWDAPFDSLIVGSQAKLAVTLSQAAGEKMYVDIKNDFPTLVGTDPNEFLTYKVGDDTQSVTIIAKEVSSGQVKVTFAVRNSPTNETRDFKFTIKSQ